MLMIASSLATTTTTTTILRRRSTNRRCPASLTSTTTATTACTTTIVAATAVIVLYRFRFSAVSRVFVCIAAIEDIDRIRATNALKPDIAFLLGQTAECHHLLAHKLAPNEIQQLAVLLLCFVILALAHAFEIAQDHHAFRFASRLIVIVAHLFARVDDKPTLDPFWFLVGARFFALTQLEQITIDHNVAKNTQLEVDEPCLEIIVVINHTKRKRAFSHDQFEHILNAFVATRTLLLSCRLSVATVTIFVVHVGGGR
mmetsp:Transcript_19283/g.30624  ORF Transcript_19283/g.30624 Transcript_19283/m.30624 type:complete len:257 (+) Transcript_19283:112-882(+)